MAHKATSPLTRAISGARVAASTSGKQCRWQVRREFAGTTRSSAARVYQPVRRPSELDTLLLLSASSRIPLLTLWTASWCRTCRSVLPIVQEAIEEFGENGSGRDDNRLDIGFVEIEYDAPENVELGERYMEAQINTRVTDAKKLADKIFLRKWISEEAARKGSGGAGGTGLLGRLANTFKSGT